MDATSRAMVEMRLREAELQINELIHTGISIGKAPGWLREARSALDGGDPDQALHLAEMIISSSQVLLEARDMAFNRISLAAAEITNAANYGIDTARALSFLQEARLAETEGRYSEAGAFAEKATAILAENISSQAAREGRPLGDPQPVHGLVRDLEQTRTELESFRVALAPADAAQLAGSTSIVQGLLEAGRFAEAEAISNGQRTERFLTPFPYPHALEMELLLVAADGRWLPLERTEELLAKSVHQALASLRSRVSLDGEAGIPRLIRRKLRRLSLENLDSQESPAQGAVAVEYKADDSPVALAVIGRGGRRASVPRSVRLATPPCAFVEELEWWAHTLFSTVYDSVAAESDCRLLSTGANPVEPFRPDEISGDRHAIFIADESERSAASEYLRGRMPEVLSVCVNSPVVDSRCPPAPADSAEAMRTLVSTDPFSARSSIGAARLMDFEVWHRSAPARRTPESPGPLGDAGVGPAAGALSGAVRPSSLGVIGIGNLDPQLSIRARIGLAVLLQSLASEGVRRWRRGESVTGEPGQVLSLNIERALQKGGLLPLDGAAGPSHVRISDSARRMVVSLRERFNDLRCHERDWLDVVLLSLWGGAGGPVAPPVSPAQYQLWLLAGSGGRAEGLSSRLWQVASKIRQDPAYDPMVAELGPPSFSKRDWCPGPAETARSGDDALSVLGDRVRALRGLGQQVPVGAQVALQVALAFKLAGKEPVSRTYAAWGLGALEPPPQRIELQGGPL